MTEPTITSLGFLSILPPLITIVLALWTKRVIESLLAGLAFAAWAMDDMAHGFWHSLLYFIPNTFSVIAGHPATETLKGIGIVKDAGRGQLLIFIVLLGSFMTVLDHGGGAIDFAKRATKYIRNKASALCTSWLIGLSIFTSAYFSILVNGTIMRPIFDRFKMSREKLAFYCHAMSVPTKAFLPISGWIAYMVTLIEENVPGVEKGAGLGAFVHTMPYNFYCWMMPLFVLFLAFGWIREFGPMRRAELRVSRDGLLHKPGSEPMVSEEHEQKIAAMKKQGHMGDMLIPVAASVLLLLVLGMWNYMNDHMGLGLPKLTLDTPTILNVGFGGGILIAFFQYTSKNLMKPGEFLDHVVKGGQSVIVGAFIIIMAVTLGDVLKAAPPEGLGTAAYIVEVTRPYIIPSMVPVMVFIIGALISFATGTSWGTWALMMPIAMPIAVAAGVNPYLTAAAVLSGGAFGDQCGPISDTSVLSALAANTNLIEHIRTQLPYALVAATVAASAFVMAGMMGW